MSHLSEIAQDATYFEQGPPPRMGMVEWHTMVSRCATTAWRHSNSQMSYSELYDLADAVLREAMGDVCPEIEP